LLLSMQKYKEIYKNNSILSKQIKKNLYTIHNVKNWKNES
jgi:hypothetical protein